ncbi:hypothetical protein [Sphingosinicella terrae]|uniref:hypothetical protein n=1 Tax=Sphingosinicella terrae TaxID=2172047 RepID=UPI000E0DAA9A|nr:hypothetical protein [Sphingosinicella terrae]
MSWMQAAPILLIALVQCAPAEAPPAAARAAAEGAAGRPRDCISLDAATSRRALDERTIRFELIGGERLDNRLPGRCPGLAQSANGFGALAFEVHGNRLCRGDRVRVVDPSGAGVGAAYRMAIPCPLGRFVPVTDEARPRR